MKNLIRILFLFPTFIIAQSNQTFQAKLIDYTKEKIPAYCGYSIAYGVLKFEIQENTQNLKKGDVIFIVQICPREKMEEIGNYLNNQIYNLAIGNEADEKFSTIGSYICEKNYPNDKPNKFWRGGVRKQ